MSMDTALLVLSTSITTAGLSFLIFVGFFYTRHQPQERTKKLKQCPTCKRWQEVT